MSEELIGQRVVLIGASAGIGLETARRARAAGAEVILTGRNSERLKQAALEVDARRTAAFDAGDPAALERFFHGLTDPIDHVLITAGGPAYGPMLAMDAAQVSQALTDHVVIALEVARRAVPRMRPGGTLLLMGGTGGRRISRELGIASAATAVLPPFTAALALEVAPVRANLIAAGFVDTPLSASLLGDGLDARRDELRRTLPIGRVVGPADVAALAVHIMTNTALTGATYDIDGGQQFVAGSAKERTMEFLVGFDVRIPDGAPESEVTERVSAEAVAAAELARQGHLLRLWKPPTSPGESKAVGLYRADSEAELDGLLSALPLTGWMQVTVTPLERHPNDPTIPRPNNFELPDARLTPVYRLEASVGEPVEVGDTRRGHRRIVPLSGGTFTGPTLSGTLIPGASADWQTVLPDGTAIGEIRYSLRTVGGDVLNVQARGVRHGRPEVLARLARGEAVDPSEYTFRTATQIEAAAGALDWLNKGVFVSVGGRQPGGVVYETYLVD